MTRLHLNAAVLAALIAAAGGAYAQDAPPAQETATDPAAAPDPTAASQLEDALVQRGYSEVANIQVADGNWTAEAVNPQGQEVALVIGVDGNIQETPR